MTQLDQLKLGDQLPTDGVTSSIKTSTVAGEHEDLGTRQTVVSAYLPTPALLATWPMKRRKKYVVEIKIESHDGTIWERRTVGFELSESSSDTEVLRQLTKMVSPLNLPNAST